jgi:hypothetical protein
MLRLAGEQQQQGRELTDMQTARFMHVLRR